MGHSFRWGKTIPEKKPGPPERRVESKERVFHPEKDEEKGSGAVKIRKEEMNFEWILQVLTKLDILWGEKGKMEFPISGRIGIFLLYVWVFWSCHLFWASADDFVPLADKHKKAGFKCEGCHRENLHKAGDSMTICFPCHRDYSRLAERTKNMIPNPHSSHLGEIACGNCHHAHKRSDDYCAQCHYFGFKVP
jgi:fumarate reductase flavoprotein subunit